MQSNVLDLHGNVVRSIDLDDRVFGIEPNRAVVHQAVVTQEANARQGTHDTRTRGEVAGGGKKPYRQKGTGYARQGSKRAPHYTGGGIVFGPHPRSYEKALPRKMRRLAMRSALSARAAEDGLTIVDSFTLEAAKTKSLLQTLLALGAPDGAVIVLGERSDAVFRAARNLDRVHVVTPTGLCLMDILKLPRLIIAEAAVAELTRSLTGDLAPAVPGEKHSRRAKATSPMDGGSPTLSDGDTSGTESGTSEAPRPRRPRAAKTEEVVDTSSEVEEISTQEAE